MEKKGMTRARVVLLGVIVVLVLFAPAQAQFEPTIEIIPPEPTSVDNIAVKVGVWLGNLCEKATFSELNRWDNVYDEAQVIFWATVIVESAPSDICLPVIVPVSHTYHLGKLEPGHYYVVLYTCVGEEGVCKPWTIEELDGVRFYVTKSLEELVCDYAGSDRRIDGVDLIRAIQDYARGELSGFDLITIIQYYASGELCDHPLSAASRDIVYAEPLAIANVSFTGNKFVVEGTGITAIQVKIFDLSGKQVLNSGYVNGQAFEWHLMNDQGEAVANGVYLYLVTVRGYDGQVITSQVKKLVILR